VIAKLLDDNQACTLPRLHKMLAIAAVVRRRRRENRRRLRKGLKEARLPKQKRSRRSAVVLAAIVRGVAPVGARHVLAGGEAQGINK